MATITTRAGKGSPLTNTEVDDNFSNLNSAKYESGASPTFGSTILTTADTVNLTLDGASANSKNIYFKGDSSAQRGRIASVGTSLYFMLTDATNYLTINPSSTVINDSSVDHDFRVESNDNANMLFVDASTNRVGVGVAAPQANLQALDLIKVSSTDQSSGSIIFGDGSTANYNVGIGRWNGTSNAAGSGGLGYHAQGPINGGGHYWYLGDATAGSKTEVMRINGSGTFIFNDGGADVDFRVESDTNANAFHVDGQYSVVGVNTNNATTYTTTNSFVSKGRDFALVGAAGSGATSNNIRFWQDSGTAYEIARIETNVGAGQINRGEMKFQVNNGAVLRRWLDVNYQGSVVFNEDGNDSDFRVESSGNSHMLFVNAGLDQVAIGSGTISAPSSYHLLSYGAGTSARSAFVHGSSDGGVVISGSAGGSSASVILGNNWGTNGATFSEEYRLLMDGADDSLNINYNANGNTALKLTSDGRTNIYGVGSEAASRFTINNDGSGTGHLQFQTAMNSQGNGYVRANIVMARNRDTIVWDNDNQTWDYTAGSSAAWSMISKTSGAMNFHIGSSTGVDSRLTNADFNATYLMYYMTPTGGHTWQAPGGGGFVFNEAGLDRDFRVESSGNASMLFVDGSGDGVGIGTSVTGNSTLEVRSTGVDGTFANAIGFQYSGNSNEANTISTAVSSNAGGSGFKFNVSDGGGSSGKTSVAKFVRNEISFNEDSYNFLDFRVESDGNANMLFVDSGNNSVGIGTNATGSTALVVQAAAGAGAISVIGRSNGGIGTLSFYDDNGASNVGYLQGRADDNQFRLWTTTADTLSLGQNDVERIKVTDLGNTMVVNGFLGNHYSTGSNGAMWSVSQFNDNDSNTGGYVVITTSANEWQPNLLKVTGTSVSSGAATPTSAVWFVRVYTYNGTVGGVSVLDSWTSGNISVSVTGTYISATSVRVNVIVTTSANRSVGNVEVLSYGGVTDAARTQ